ncbi:MAG: ATP-dependent DNA helicase RecG [bacterium]|nr:MAG: ATP-dependent DNA helicase RecG [bacterium]
MDHTPSATPLTALKGVGDKVARKLESLGIGVVEDLPFFLPRAYQDRTHPQPITSLLPGTVATVRGQVLSLRERRYRRRVTLEMMVSDGRGVLIVKWFHFSRWLKRNLEQRFPVGGEILATGRTDSYAGVLEMHHPDLAEVDEDGGEGIVPIYPLTEGVTQRQMRTIVARALERTLEKIHDPLPERTLQRHRLPDLRNALMGVHRPPAGSDVEALNGGDSPCHRRLKFGELFFFQLGVLHRKHVLESCRAVSLPADTSLESSFLRSLPFTLTSAQRRVLDEIGRDLEKEVPMHRLLQGDVGSGKTLVAFMAMLRAAASGRQAVLMAPTEILAEQHFRNMVIWSDGFGVGIHLITGGVTGDQRREALLRAREEGPAIFVGTHALIQEGVSFRSLALAVVDEQHRFGVMQRLTLRDKGRSPHFLVMTATPIPRSMGMVLYGDLDISTIDELPPGRKTVVTQILGESDRAKLHLSIAKEVKEGRQVYIVYPLVEETDRSALLAAREMAEKYRDKIFPNMRIGLLTGRMPPREKEEVMGAFREGHYQVLVATTVIEVGVDVPNATLMVVEHAERFGLFQLHQLRGRVGRGGHQSRCILMTGPQISGEAMERLQAMARTESGFEIAEEDLRIRGPGDFLGTRQSGMPDFRYAHPLVDRDLLADAREEADRVLAEGAQIPAPLAKEVERIWAGRLNVAVSG